MNTLTKQMLESRDAERRWHALDLAVGSDALLSTEATIARAKAFYKFLAEDNDRET